MQRSYTHTHSPTCMFNMINAYMQCHHNHRGACYNASAVMLEKFHSYYEPQTCDVIRSFSVSPDGLFMNIVFIFLRLEHRPWLYQPNLTTSMLSELQRDTCVIFVFSVELSAFMQSTYCIIIHVKSLPCGPHPYSGHIITSPGKRTSLKHLCLWTKLKYLPLWTTSNPAFQFSHHVCFLITREYVQYL